MTEKGWYKYTNLPNYIYKQPAVFLTHVNLLPPCSGFTTKKEVGVFFFKGGEEIRSNRFGFIVLTPSVKIKVTFTYKIFQKHQFTRKKEKNNISFKTLSKNSTLRQKKLILCLIFIGIMINWNVFSFIHNVT